MRSSRSDANQAISKSRSRTAKASGSFIKPSARLMPWPLQQAKSHLLRFRNSPLKSGSFVGKQAHGSDQSGSGGDPVHQRKRILHFGSGILNDEPILAGVAASTVSGALEAFVRAVAIELHKGLRINVVSPTMLKESESQFAQFFTGMIPVEGWKVGQAYKRAILGAQTGRVYKVE